MLSELCDGGVDVDVRIGRLDDASGSEVVGDSADEPVGGFYVKDTGSGIPPENREEVFDYNYTASDGTGFGLAIVQEIVKAHGWEITVTDGTTGGAQFEIRRTEGASTDDRQ
ncbi:sensor histidine kinase [Haladaptatus halobius]|uniref:sensor histidine kinase n=1 Tax=Haladaptatus halobius TaxID=2884875 RepID=UPI001D0A9CFC|nr:HAMP domain-containing sensor histidine kinase [Haladaptatus halobius]